ncbi:MAG: hypothetical protein IJU03_00090 [Thermoguttaceae bacterium]|nr:hypothetical protein [Thermoguttaceae bacterium]
MCEILDRIEARGVKLGFEQGVEQGIEQGVEIGRLQIQREMAADLRQRGWSDEEIAEHLKVAVVDVKIWLDSEEN